MVVTKLMFLGRTIARRFVKNEFHENPTHGWVAGTSQTDGRKDRLHSVIITPGNRFQCTRGLRNDQICFAATVFVLQQWRLWETCLPR